LVIVFWRIDAAGALSELSIAADRTGRKLIALATAVVAAASLGRGIPAEAESIGGAEIVVNEVKGNLAPGRVVAILRGDEVYRDEGVRTGADGSAKLVLHDNTVVTVGPSSLVKLDRFVYAGEGQRGAIALNVLKGSLVFVTGNAEKHSYLITTPTAALGVRGTIFRVEATASRTRVVLVEGALNVCMRSLVNRRCVDLDHPGQEAVVSVTQIAVTENPASPSPGGGANVRTGSIRGAPAATSTATASAPGAAAAASASAPGAAAAASASAPGAAAASASAPGAAAASPGHSNGGTTSGPGPGSGGTSGGSGPGNGNGNSGNSNGGGNTGGTGPGTGNGGDPGGQGNGNGGTGNSGGSGSSGHGSSGHGNGNGNGNGNGK
jgi:hypothetical protein